MDERHTLRVARLLHEIQQLSVGELVVLREALREGFGDLPPDRPKPEDDPSSGWGGGGVREPRHPHRPTGETGVALDLPEEEELSSEPGPGSWTD